MLFKKNQVISVHISPHTLNHLNLLNLISFSNIDNTEKNGPKNSDILRCLNQLSQNL